MKSLLIQSFIDPVKWDQAQWVGAAFLHDQSGIYPPYMGIVFQRVDVGKQIFAEWRNRLGKVDAKEKLRIAIIEGPIRGEGAGYSVHISSDPSAMEDSGADRMVVVSRVHRMTPQPGSPHLARFKKEFQKHRRYSLIPVSLNLEPFFDDAIEKTKVTFRNAFDISKNDQDAVVFPEGYFDSVH